LASRKRHRKCRRVSSNEKAPETGPFQQRRSCGKTESARQVAASEVLLDLDEAAQATAQVDPALVLEGRPRG
jgi:hypothetical protein